MARFRVLVFLPRLSERQTLVYVPLVLPQLRSSKGKTLHENQIYSQI